MDYLDNSVAIHQPNYLPWLGYFYKIYLADHFMFHDSVDFNQRSYTKRTLVRKELGYIESQWLILPIKKGKETKISEIKIAHGKLSIDKHLRKLNYIYQKATFYKTYFPFLRSLLSTINDVDSLSEFNIHLIKGISRKLDLNTKFYLSSDYLLNESNSDLNLKLIQQIKGQKYISGTGAKKYQNELDFKENNLQLIYSNALDYLNHHPYTQTQGPKLMGLTIVDALMNIGKEGIITLFQNMLNKLIEDSTK